MYYSPAAIASWKQMFGEQATDEQVKACMDKVINDSINNYKKQEARYREERKKRQKELEEG